MLNFSQRYTVRHQLHDHVFVAVVIETYLQVHLYTQLNLFSSLIHLATLHTAIPCGRVYPITPVIPRLSFPAKDTQGAIKKAPEIAQEKKFYPGATFR